MNTISITKKPELSLWDKVKSAAPWSIGAGIAVGAAAFYAAWVIAPAVGLYFLGYTALTVTQPIAYAAAAYLTYKAAKTAGTFAVSRAESKLSRQTHQKTMADIDTYIDKKIKERLDRETEKSRADRDRKSKQNEWMKQNKRSKQAVRPKRARKLTSVFRKRDDGRDMAA